MVDRILRLIKEKGLTVNAVEKQLGFGNGAIKRFATNSPSIEKIIALSNFLNVSIDYIINGTTDVIDKKTLSGHDNSLTINGHNIVGNGNNVSDTNNHHKNNNYSEIIDYLNNLNASQRRHAIADIMDILEEQYPLG